MAPTAEPAVVVNGATKTFVIPSARVERFHALRGVSFEVGQGEFFGVVGRNGSGKSTLLKCLGGIYRLDGGGIQVRGRVSPFIELGVGFHPEMAARENIVMNGVMLGLTPQEARARVDNVIEFAELEEFADLKLKNYSSGMHVRLAFSVMVQVDADVLLIDEILAVGDASFQQKCFDVFFRMREEGKTIVFVTHDMAAVERFCHRALLLERGEIVELGEPRTVADRYLRLNFERGGPGEPEGFGARRGGDGAARVVEAWMEDEHGARQSAFMQGARCTFKARARFDRRVDDPTFAAAFVSSQRQNVFVASSATEIAPTGSFEPGDEVTFSVTFENALSPGRYALSTLIAHPGAGEAAIDRYENIFSVVVTGSRPAGGVVDLPHELTIERAAEPAREAT